MHNFEKKNSNFLNYDVVGKIAIVGDSGVGKSSLLQRIVYNTFEHHNNTIGVDFKVGYYVRKDDDKKIKLQFWDTAGQERFRTIAKSYYRNVDIIIIVYDANDYDSFNNIFMWLREISEACVNNPTIIVVGNKYDNDTDLWNIDKFKIDNLLKLTNNKIFTYFLVSSLNNINIDSLLYFILDNICHKICQKNNNKIYNKYINFTTVNKKKFCIC